MAPGKRESYPEKGRASPEKGRIENTRKNGIFWGKWAFSYMRPRALLKTIINNIKNRKAQKRGAQLGFDRPRERG